MGEGAGYVHQMNGFAVVANDRRYSEAEGLQRVEERAVTRPDGALEIKTVFAAGVRQIRVERYTVHYPGSAVVEQWLEIVNGSEGELKLTRIDTVQGTLAPGAYTLDYFMNHANGTEFIPVTCPLEGTKVLDCTAGRSSRLMHPWLTLRGAEGGVFACSVAWSGNWILRLEPEAGSLYRLSGGLHDWEFFKVLQPGGRMESVHILYAEMAEGGLNEISIEFGRWGKQFWYPSNAITEAVPAAWNHWWPYEDSAINEDVFKSNVDAAAELGLEICTLDAGWFGEPNPECNDHLGWSENVDWYLKRGDWHKINTIRFPSGIADLSEYVHSKGMKFGIWCEIEALGVKADLAALHPEYAALRDGEQLGYVCFGNPEARQWAFETLQHLIVDYKADWLKLDFNLDPKCGCNRTDHGHGDGDGLYEHYMGYYQVLTRIRELYPEVYLENCSSGGLRIDLGLAKHTHGAFLSDPDFTRHHLQLFWGASMMLHPSACYHFTWSQTIVHYDSNVDKDPIKPDMPLHKFDYMIRANMLNSFACSYRLPELPDWAQRRLGYHIGLYKSMLRKFVGEGDMHRLTGPTLRDGTGEQWNAYFYVMKERNEAVLFIFRLDGGDDERRTFRLQGLNETSVYELMYEDGGEYGKATGLALMEEGLSFELEPEASQIVYVRRMR
ncbi:alpha-galactosidase [Paenibacillus gansuensis]|uniref:alpha-galactosidase n=1 Tax=Paenibacillus gansuensis TaxID=306542 RepID=A0ABW5PFM9_9BACL